MSTIEHELSKNELISILRFIVDCRNADERNSLKYLMEQLQYMVTINQTTVGICRVEQPINTQIQPITFLEIMKKENTACGEQANAFHRVKRLSARDQIQDLRDVNNHSNKSCAPQHNARIEWMDGLLRSCQRLERESVMSCVYIKKNSIDLPIKERTILEYVVPHLLEVVYRIYMRESNGVPPSLTAREKEVLLWIIEGKSSWAIARALRVSERTVKFHLGNIYIKLGVNTRVQVATLAMKLALL